MRNYFILLLSITCSTYVAADSCAGLGNSGDAADKSVWMEAMACAERDRYVRGLDFKQSYWDDGFGWNMSCREKNSPLVRTLNGITLLYAGMPTGYKKNNWLRHGYYRTSSNINDLRAKCYSPRDGAPARTDYGGIFSGEHVEVYRSFFTGPVIDRAAALVHEGVHAGGKRHTARGKNFTFIGGAVNACKIGTDNCDVRFNDGGAYSATILWAWWYAVDGDKVTSNIRKSASDMANWYLDNAFVEANNVTAWYSR